MRGVIPGGINPNLISLTGAIVTWWSMVEGLLVNDIISMNAVDAVSADAECWPVQVSTDRLINQWARARRKLSSQWTDDQLDLDGILVELRYCSKIRHRLVHGFWGFGSRKNPKADHVIQVTKPTRGKRDSFDSDRYLITVETLDQLNSKIAKLYHCVMIAMMRQTFAQTKVPTASTAPLQGIVGAHLQPPKSILDQ